MVLGSRQAQVVLRLGSIPARLQLHGYPELRPRIPCAAPYAPLSCVPVASERLESAHELLQAGVAMCCIVFKPAGQGAQVYSMAGCQCSFLHARVCPGPSASNNRYSARHPGSSAVLHSSQAGRQHQGGPCNKRMPLTAFRERSRHMPPFRQSRSTMASSHA